MDKSLSRTRSDLLTSGNRSSVAIKTEQPGQITTHSIRYRSGIVNIRQDRSDPKANNRVWLQVSSFDFYFGYKI